MRLVLHRSVYGDISEIMAYYQRIASRRLADEFYAELRSFLINAQKRPESIAIRERDVRRVNLRRFPYHFLFRVVENKVRILVVRHHKRHPSFGRERR